MIYFVSPDNFNDVEVILKQLQIRTTDYYRLRSVSCDKKTIVNVIHVQNMG